MFPSKPVRSLCLIVILSSLSVASLHAQELSATPSPSPQADAAQAADSSKSPFEKAFERLEWRSIGPANMGGRTADVEGVPGNPNLVYVATASGGLWKTINGGVTWKPIFERQGTISIGDIALAPGNPDVVWVGTGESKRATAFHLAMVFTSQQTAGKTWQHMGLRDTERISAIAIHPQNPDIVYVGALGHAFGPNENRGVFMTTDGGKTWTKTLYIDREHGVSDLEMDSTNPNILYAGMWSFERKPWTHRSGSEKGGVYKSIDGGRTWDKLTNGLPKLHRQDRRSRCAEQSECCLRNRRSKEGTLYRSDDRGETFRQVSKEPNASCRVVFTTPPCASIRPTRTESTRWPPHSLYRLTAAKLSVQSPAELTSTTTRSGSIRKTRNECGKGRTAASQYHTTPARILGIRVYNIPLGAVLSNSCRQPLAVLLRDGRTAGQWRVDWSEPDARAGGNHERRLAHGEFWRWFLRTSTTRTSPRSTSPNRRAATFSAPTFARASNRKLIPGDAAVVMGRRIGEKYRFNWNCSDRSVAS